MRPLATALLFFLTTITLAAQSPTPCPQGQQPVLPFTGSYTPLTADQRWHHYVHETFLSPGLYFAALSVGGGSQLAKDPPEWGQGFTAYTKRAATFLAAYAIQNTVHEAGDAALGYDPRYISCDCKGAPRRLAHAFVWSFLTKNAQGHTRFNAPVVAGAYGGEMLSYLWYPTRYSPLKDGFREGSQEVGITVGVNIFREFAPELKHFFGANPGQ